ncbi:MAG TPA: UbiA family prenyltransferase [Chitinophagaceae bacterium]|nr:UbiA family prenyltransferase [Chitinophagaceae bacterium]
MNSFFKKIFDFFLFTSLFVSGCAVVMVYQTYALIINKPPDFHLAAFVFFSTICSYNFHWALTPNSIAPSQRLQWEAKHKRHHLLLSIIGLTGAGIFFFYLKDKWFYILPSAILTFLYSAPKIPYPLFQLLKKIAIGKTIFLAAIWTYVTAALPVLIEGSFSEKAILFCIGQFFFIYAICILFDFRDKEDDKADGIRSMITYFNEQGVNALFLISISIFIVLSLLLQRTGVAWPNILLLIFPSLPLIGLFNYSKRNFSDYLYYFVLDGLMMLSGLLLWIMNRF